MAEKIVIWFNIFLQQALLYGVAIGFCISASLLSIINKWAVTMFPYPGALTALQYLTSVLVVIIFGALNLIDHDRLDLLMMWRFLPAAVIFYMSLFTNSELLLHANVDTFIVFRCAVPMFVAAGETLFLHQPWPSPRTWFSLVAIFFGSLVYVMNDSSFTVAALTWGFAYLATLTVDLVYIKHVVMTVGLNTWGLVLYNNLEALLLFPGELLVMGEWKTMETGVAEGSFWAVALPVGLSCMFGVAISFFAFACRRAITATGFTVLGVVNKLVTVAVNLLVWDKHSSFLGTVGILICIGGGILYQQSTTTKKPDSAKPEVPVSDEEQQKLLNVVGGDENCQFEQEGKSI